MSTYMWLLVIIIAVPLAAAVWPWRFRWTSRQWRRFSLVTILVSLPWIILDMWSHGRGWWQYSPEHTSLWRIIGLPIEEVLFFVVVPFACLALLSGIERSTSQRYLPHRVVITVCGVIVVAAAVMALLISRERTIFDAILAIIVIAVMASQWQRWTISDGIWWLVVIGLFLICNTILTSVPIVTYNYNYGSMVRIGSIPVEDVFYNLSLLGCVWLVWRRGDGSAQH